MNRVAKTLLNLMRIEVLLGIGLVLWVFSLEVRAEGYPQLSQLSQITSPQNPAVASPEQLGMPIVFMITTLPAKLRITTCRTTHLLYRSIL